MDINKLMNICGITAYSRAIEYAAERLYHYGVTAAEIRKNNVENWQFYEQVADYMDYMQDMQDITDKEEDLWNENQ